VRGSLFVSGWYAGRAGMTSILPAKEKLDMVARLAVTRSQMKSRPKM
jgi:hypothetical protein